MPTQSAPIDIASPNRRYDSNSPRNKTSNLTSALQAANGVSPVPFSNNSRGDSMDARPIAARKDSLAVPYPNSQSGAKPISTSSRTRRESGPGSFMGGMSWGGMSIGSYLQDDMMSGMSPGVGSPSFHSSSYLPRMEANFWNNLKCCDNVFGNLHELVNHFETSHPRDAQAPSLPRRKSSSTNPGDWNAQNQHRGFQPWQENKLNGLPSARLGQPFQDNMRKPSTVGMQDMDTIGEMELDDDSTMPGQGYDQYEQQHDGYPVDTTPQMRHAQPDGVSNGYHSSNSSTPPGGHQMHANYSNAMFSNMTQQLNAQTQPQQSRYEPNSTFGQMSAGPSINGGFQAQGGANPVQFNSQMFDKLSSNFGRMDFGSGNDMRDLCINEPAKNLYSDDGTFNTQQFPQFNFNGGSGGAGDITSNNDENARKLQAQRLAAGVGKQPTEEERPFKCPVIGCEKAYKNANGLRYHEKHGHSNQKLKDNGNGTFSIVDPVTSIPYPGTVGMEKEKPYRCEVCGKRYKNLNGLKYHRNHSPPCNPDFQMNQMPNMAETEAVY